MTHARALLRACRRGAPARTSASRSCSPTSASAQIAEHPRRFNVGIREQLMIGVAAGLALEGYRPIVHSYTPFVIERPYEQIKLDLGHQDVGAVLVSTARRTTRRPRAARTRRPRTSPLLAALPGWTIHVPGHRRRGRADVRAGARGDDRVYIRLSDETNHAPVRRRGLVVVREGSDGRPRARRRADARPRARGDRRPRRDGRVSRDVRPFDADGLRAAVRGTDVVLVEPYLAGTSAGEVSRALSDRPHRLLALGVPQRRVPPLRRRRRAPAAHGLDAAGIRASIERFASAKRRL